MKKLLYAAMYSPELVKMAAQRYFALGYVSVKGKNVYWVHGDIDKLNEESLRTAFGNYLAGFVAGWNSARK